MPRGKAQAVAFAGHVEEPWLLPQGWRWERIEAVAPVNTRRLPNDLAEDAEISFVPMSAVEALTGKVDVSEKRRVGTVRQGFTKFASDDVIFAKITPCMENGKVAVVPPLPHGIGCGSTEFHVLAPVCVTPRYLYYWVSQRSFRENAEFHMTGTAGQKRVPPDFLRSAVIPVPRMEVQRRIVARIDELFAEIDDGEEALARAEADLDVYRRALLKGAITGKLTADWRAANPPAETGSDFLRRILADRRSRWEANPRNRGKRYLEPAPLKTSTLPKLPEGWTWASVEQLICELRNGISSKPDHDDSGTPILRISAVREMSVRLLDRRWLNPALPVHDALAEPGDLLFTRYNGSPELVGVCGLHRGTEAIAYPDKLIRARPVMAGVLADYAEMACNVGQARAHIEAFTKTSAGQHGVSGSTIKSAPVPLPPLAEAENIVVQVRSKLSAAGNLVSAVTEQASNAQSLRQSILSAAFRGELAA